MTDGQDPFNWLGDGFGRGEAADPQTQEMIEEARRQQMEFALMVHEVFVNSPRGMILLQHLRDLTIEAPLMRVSGSMVEGEVALSPAEWAYVREGQNSVIRFIETQIQIAGATEEPEEPKQ